MGLNIKKRYLEESIGTDAIAKGKMAFISGPRQCGKTTLAQGLLKKQGEEKNYFTWDDDEFRKKWVKNPKQVLDGLRFSESKKPLVVFDELHKHKDWKRSLKGLYDIYKEKINILVTGSVRLDIYRKSGDSLQGRYFPYRLHPFTLGETDYIKPPPQKDWFAQSMRSFPLEDLLTLGGFPELLLGGVEAEAQRWQRLRRERLVREDLRDLKSVRDLQAIENLILFLQDGAAQPLFFQSLEEDLQVSFSTIKDWVKILESLYFCFLLRPYTKKIRRSLKKEPKLYLYDWSVIKDKGAKIENLVAAHLLKSCHAWTDLAFGYFELFYIRDKEKREVDFLIMKDDQPFALIEVKSNQQEISKSLIHFSSLLKPKFVFQVVTEKKYEKRVLSTHPEIVIVEAGRFLSALN